MKESAVSDASLAEWIKETEAEAAAPVPSPTPSDKAPADASQPRVGDDTSEPD